MEPVEAILDALAFRVHVLTLGQIAQAWFPGHVRPEGAAKRLMERLASKGLVCAKREYSYSLLSLNRPVFSWLPGDPEPEAGMIAYQLQSRWPDESPMIVDAFSSTPRLATRIGGFDGRLRHRDQITHDLHLSEVFLHYLRNFPSEACRWSGEELRKRGQRYGEKLPDALIIDDAGRPLRAIEFGGRYPKNRVREFFEHCARRNLAFDLW